LKNNWKRIEKRIEKEKREKRKKSPNIKGE
jgi:hypothetical protein